MAGQAALKKESDAGMSAKGSSFYAAMRIMPANQRQAMYEIYRFCRVIDDIGDEAGQAAQKLAQLNQWRSDIAAIYAGSPHQAIEGLARTVTGFGLRKQDLLAIIDGVEMDVHGPIQAPDFATLITYCDRVACAVGRLSVRVFGMDEESGLALSHHLGLALQLTNILRDIDEDAKLDRLYLPCEWLRDAGIESTNPASVVMSPALPAVCARLCSEALSHFTAANTLMKQCERSQVRTPHVMSQAYQSILTALMERGFSYPRQPVHVSKIRLVYILMRNLLF